MSERRLELLKSMAFFGGLDDEALGYLLERAKSCEIHGGGHFFDEGDSAQSMFVLTKGSIEIIKDCNDEPLTLAKLGPGDCFGEMALVDLGPRSASVIATEDCAALEIPLSVIHEVYRANPKQFALIQMNISRELSRRLRLADSALMRAHNDLTEKPAEK